MVQKYPVELLAWVMVLFLLALSNPALHHYTLCPLSNLGFTWCPGCGLGRSISALFHLDFSGSLKYHWFGIPALLILLNRIWKLSKKSV